MNGNKSGVGCVLFLVMAVSMLLAAINEGYIGVPPINLVVVGVVLGTVMVGVPALVVAMKTNRLFLLILLPIAIAVLRLTTTH